LNISDGVTPYTIHWNTGDSTTSLTGLSAGTYTYVVTDSTGCAQPGAILIQNNTGNLAINNALVQEEYCLWGNGSIDISIQGGTGPFTYQWSSGETTQDLNNISTGIYSVTLIDALGCTDNASYYVGHIDFFDINDTMIVDASCPTCNDGSITLTISPPGPMTYNWSNGATTQNISGLLPGTYTVTITDQYGCTVIETYTVSSGTIVASQENLINSVNVFPNPSSGLFNVEYTLKSSGDVTIEVFNVLGETVTTAVKNNSRKGIVVLDLSTSNPGIYMIRLKAGNDFILKRQVIQK
jgi:hypothetical protein